MTELEQYLQATMGVPAEDMRTLMSFFRVTTLEKGDYFLKAGRVCDKLSFHSSGLLRTYAQYGDKEVTQWISFPGNFITDLGGLICNQPSRFDIRALTYCELYTIDSQDYMHLPEVIPRWLQMERLLITHCFRFMETRVFSLLSMSAEERYRYLQDQNPDVFNSVPLKYLASMLGMTPESLSRIRKQSMI